MTRADSSPRETVAGVTITHADRLLFPDSDVTKGDLGRYFERIWPRLEPHLAGRPLAFLRCPEGARGECFFQKHWQEDTAGLLAIDVSTRAKREAPHVGVASLPGLVSLAQYGVVELHLWGARSGSLERPDRLVFDLDPGEGVAWRELAAAARVVRELLRRLGLESFLLATGGKGLHVVAPLTPNPELGWNELRATAAEMAKALERSAPGRFVSRADKSARAGRIFVDYLRNGRGATAIAPFSPRARAGAPVAVPLDWGELASPGMPLATVDTFLRRLDRRKHDPWSGYFTVEQTLRPGAFDDLLAELAGEGLPEKAIAMSPKSLEKGPRKSRADSARSEKKSGEGKSTPKKTAKKKTAEKNRYGELASENVEKAMHEMREGELRSGSTGRKVTSRKQAVAIGLSEARRAGGKVPKKAARRKK